MSTRKAVGYIRRSDPSQRDNHSFDIQKDKISSVASIRGFHICEWYQDDGVSAFHINAVNRVGMGKLLERALHDDIEAMFYYDESRLSRKMGHDFYQHIYLKIREKKPFFLFVNSSMNTEYDPDDLGQFIHIVNDHDESRKKQGRARDAQKTALEKGIRPGSRIPYGYDMVDGILVPNEKRGYVFVIFFYASWGHSLETIAAFLNENKIPSPTSGVWQASTVEYILKNRAYIGDMEWSDTITNLLRDNSRLELFKKQHEPLVPLSLWTMVKEVSEWKARTGKFDTPYLLRGVAYCNTCGGLLKAKDQTPSRSTKKYRYYKCRSCNRKVNAISVEQHAEKYLSNNWKSILGQLRDGARRILRNWKNELLKSKEEFEKQLQSVKVSSMRNNLNEFTKEVIDRAIRTLQNKILELSNAIYRIKELIEQGIIDSVLDSFETTVLTSLNRTEKRVLYLATINRIEINMNEGRIAGVEYRVSPFISFESFIGRITEKNSNLLDE